MITIDRKSREAIFEKWKGAVNLKPEFPSLRPISDEAWAEVFYQGVEQARLIDQLLKRASSPLLAVVVTKGHGATTLSRHVFREIAKRATDRRLLPVRLSLDDFVQDHPTRKPQEFRLWVEQSLREGIVRSLVLDNWDWVLDQRAYAGLLGAVRSDLGGDGVSESDEANPNPNWLAEAIECRREFLRALLSDRSTRLDKLSDASPVFTKSLAELTSDLSRSWGVRISLQFDLSSALLRAPDSQRKGDRYTAEFAPLVNAVKKVMKDFVEVDATSSNPTFPTVLNEIYFLSQEAFDILTDGWPRAYTEIEFPWYRPADIFAMLANHYPPNRAPGTPPADALASILDSNYLVPHVSHNRSLAMIVEEFRAGLLDEFHSWDDLPYQLTPWHRKLDELRRDLEKFRDGRGGDDDPRPAKDSPR